MVEIIKQLKKVLKAVSILQNTIFNHHTRHEDGGGDEISIEGLSGHAITFNLGVAAVGTKLAQALIPGTFNISTVILWGDNAPIGADLIVDINKNGITIFTTQPNRPKITDGSNSGESGTPDIISLAKGDRLSVDIDQVGSTTPGGDDLLVTIIM